MVTSKTVREPPIGAHPRLSGSLIAGLVIGAALTLPSG